MASLSVPTTDQPSPDTPATRPSGPSRIISAENAKATGKFLKAFGKTAVSMHPLWLMGEAVTGQKVGSNLKANSRELIQASEAMRDLLATSATDIVIIVNDKLREKGGTETSRAAEVIKKAGDNAIVVVSSSIEKAQDQLKKNSPALKRSIQKNGKQVVVVVDKALKNPLVITGIHKYARAQGIPHPEAILTVAALALSKILAEFPSDEELAAGEHVDEIDAADLERMSTKEADDEAKDIGRQAQAHLTAADAAAGPSNARGSDGQKKKDGGCVLM